MPSYTQLRQDVRSVRSTHKERVRMQPLVHVVACSGRGP